MAADAWKVHNPGVQEFHLLMRRAVDTCGTIIEGVEATLAPMPQAAQASGMPLWDDLRSQWRTGYNNMDNRLKGNAVAGQGAHDAVLWGDGQSVRIMS
jgi:hypothetical protein